ncbi:uncharacterized protein LOC144147339 isoform X1 [Haemaphysalis longicornis]
MGSLINPLLLIVLSHVGHLQPAWCKCPVLKAVQQVNWKMMQGVDWFEVLNNPGPLHKCVVRKYLPEHQLMTWKEKTGPYGNVTEFKKYAFIVQGGQQFLKKDKSFFQQILDTDHYTWALLHICAEADSISKLTLTLRQPLSVIPWDIENRILEALQNAGLPKETRWTRSPCMINSTVDSITVTKEIEPPVEPTQPSEKRDEANITVPEDVREPAHKTVPDDLFIYVDVIVDERPEEQDYIRDLSAHPQA